MLLWMDMRGHNPFTPGRSYLIDLRPNGQGALYFDSDNTVKFSSMYGNCQGSHAAGERSFAYPHAFNTWVHFAIVSDPTGTRLFKDGELLYEALASSCGTSYSTALVDKAVLGSYYNSVGSSGSYFMDASIDDLQFYRSALSAQEVHDVYAATLAPTPAPTAFPTPYPTAFPTPYPTAFPSAFPTPYPTAFPTAFPTPYPTAFPTADPTPSPTADPTFYPTAFPTPYPTAFPTPYPTAFPTPDPTADPTPHPTAFPTLYPTAFPTPPTADPTFYPTAFPTPYPTAFPTPYPTAFPTPDPTADPTPHPTAFPTLYPTAFPTPYPTASPTAFPTPYPTADPTPYPTALNPTAVPATMSSAVGDPHLQNIHGERFDLMKTGRHVLIHIPRRSDTNILLRVDGDVQRLGGQCADIYFQELNITGSWANVKRAGGFHYRAQGGGHQRSRWVKFGTVQVKVAHGRTHQGFKYLNLYVKNLGRAGYQVGGLLGEDDHTKEAMVPESCHHRVAL
ncbi:unnamed protein product [Prorocentrum cordatum]|uniref:Uncharacterized protein n=1 Tax=Prorocentrum cordatum TaxID=2364126 RepID=A0ABN9QWK8_9DINO|nr:unnamed protein product [Polarella glacialis]